MQTSVKETLPRHAASGTTRAGTSALWAYIVAAGLAIFYFVTSIQIAAHRVFWFDELFTLHIARLPQLSTIWTALSNGVDALPPTYYMTVRLFDSLFGPGDVAARVPSMIAMCLGLLLIFDCARRLTDGLHGLIALSVATCSFLPYYGYEARSYAIYFMLAALALWAWTNASLSRNAQAVLFGAAFFAGVCYHYYFGMCLLPFALSEFLRWKPGQRPSLKIVAGFIGCVIPVLLLSPLILSFSRKFAGGYWNRPSFLELRAIYSQLFPDGLFLLALIAIWIVLSRSDDAKPETIEPMQPAEATGWLFLAIPLAAFVVAVWKTNAFYSRYFIGVLPGVAVAFAFMLWRHFRHITQIAMGAFLLLAGWGVMQQLTVVRHPDKVEATGIRPFLDVESSLHLEGKRYYVFSGPLLFLEAQQYSAHPEQVVLLLPSDFSHEAKPGPDPYLHQRLEVNLAQYYPMQIWTVDDLAQHRADSALIQPDDTALKDLRQAGIPLTNRFAQPVQVDYLQ
jgi:uncharacterized membrane protein